MSVKLTQKTAKISLHFMLEETLKFLTSLFVTEKPLSSCLIAVTDTIYGDLFYSRLEQFSCSMYVCWTLRVPFIHPSFIPFVLETCIHAHTLCTGVTCEERKVIK